MFGDTGILDNFNRADGGLGSNWTGPFDPISSQVPVILSNVVTGANDYNSAYWNVTSFDPQVDVYFTVPSVSTLFDATRLFVRCQNMGTGTFCAYMAKCSSTTGVTFSRYINNVGTTLGTVSFNVAINQSVGFRAITKGNDVVLEVYANTGSGFTYRGEWLDYAAITNFPLLANGGYIGFSHFALGPTDLRESMDDFGGGNSNTYRFGWDKYPHTNMRR